MYVRVGLTSRLRSILRCLNTFSCPLLLQASLAYYRAGKPSGSAGPHPIGFGDGDDSAPYIRADRSRNRRWEWAKREGERKVRRTRARVTVGWLVGLVLWFPPARPPPARTRSVTLRRRRAGSGCAAPTQTRLRGRTRGARERLLPR